MRTVTQQIIGHVDGDAFYVACERVRHPELERKPVGVLGNWGACIIAKSYELKARGVHTGMPIWDAQKVCPEAIYVKRDFEWYEVLSRRMLDVVKQLSPLVEYYSVDELFFDASLLVSVHKKAPLEAARELQRRILYEVGVPVTVGISSSKLLAKLASDTAKPFGCAVAITPEDRQKLLMGKSVEDITGIAKRRRKTLESHGIYTCDQFVKADRLRIRKLITKMGEDMWWELNGYSVLPLRRDRPPHKKVARGGSVGEATGSRDRVEGWLIRNVERLADALDHYGYVCDELGLFLGFKDGGGSYGTATLLGPTASFEYIAPVARQLLETGWKEGRKVHYMHLFAEHLQFKEFAQRSMFVQEPDPSMTTVCKAINDRVGRFKLRSGATLPLTDVYGDPANDYDICDIYGKTCF